MVLLSNRFSDGVNFASSGVLRH